MNCVHFVLCKPLTILILHRQCSCPLFGKSCGLLLIAVNLKVLSVLRIVGIRRHQSVLCESGVCVDAQGFAAAQASFHVGTQTAVLRARDVHWLAPGLCSSITIRHFASVTSVSGSFCLSGKTQIFPLTQKFWKTGQVHGAQQNVTRENYDDREKK